MKKFSSIILVGIVIVFATASFGYAATSHGGGAGGFAGHAPSGHFQGHPAVSGRPHFDGRHFDGRHFDRRFHGGAFIAAPFYWPYAYPYPYADAPASTYDSPAQSYWYYCPSYGAYYPSVQTCPDAWVPVPAQ